MPRLFYESIVGNVTNNSGAVVPGATVTVMQTQTNESRSAVTNNSDYVVSTVTTGTYTVAISKPGFQVLETKDVNVTISTTVRVDG
jgi:Carboxypeptidase regulatory-like domain